MGLTKFLFDSIYSVADQVEKSLDYHSYYGLWSEPEQFLKPCRYTILHNYIYGVVSVNMRVEFRKQPDDIIEKFLEDPDHWEIDELFEQHKIPCVLFRQVYETFENEDEIETEEIYKWFLDQENAFEILWGIMTDEAFHILFFNRNFLRKFNLMLAEVVRDGETGIPSEKLTNKGTIRRVNIPQWLKRAVFHRDRGRCVMCQADLSGLFTVVNKIHYDHIVPLSQMGTNDSTNFQLLCEKCNLKKSDKSTATSLFYEAWW